MLELLEQFGGYHVVGLAISSRLSEAAASWHAGAMR
jgi:hypothetical protein